MELSAGWLAGPAFAGILATSHMRIAPVSTKLLAAYHISLCVVCERPYTGWGQAHLLCQDRYLRYSSLSNLAHCLNTAPVVADLVYGSSAVLTP